MGKQGRLPDDPVFLIDIFTQEAEPLLHITPEDLTLFVRDENIRADLIGIYLQDQISVGKKFKFLVGGRLINYQKLFIDVYHSLTMSVPTFFFLLVQLSSV